LLVFLSSVPVTVGSLCRPHHRHPPLVIASIGRCSHRVIPSVGSGFGFPHQLLPLVASCSCWWSSWLSSWLCSHHIFVVIYCHPNVGSIYCCHRLLPSVASIIVSSTRTQNVFFPLLSPLQSLVYPSGLVSTSCIHELHTLIPPVASTGCFHWSMASIAAAQLLLLLLLLFLSKCLVVLFSGHRQVSSSLLPSLVVGHVRLLLGIVVIICLHRLPP
jgi:hypothetical protein